MKKIITRSHEENWHVGNELVKKGYVKAYDCMWGQKYVKGDDVVLFDFVYDFGK